MSRLRAPAIMTIVGGGYLAAAFVGLAVSSGAFVTLWPPNGVLIAAFLLVDARLRPLLVVATFPANFLFNAWYHLPSTLNVAYWMANVVECVIAAKLLRRVQPSGASLSRLEDVLRFAAVVVGSTAIGAAIGGLVTHAWFPDTPFGSVWRAWWTSDLLGVLTVAPVILSSPAATRGLGTLRPSTECLAFAGALALAVVATVGAPLIDVSPDLALQPFIVPLLGWSALRLGVAGTSWAALVLSFLAVMNHVHDVRGTSGHLESTAVVQAVLSGLTITFLAIAAAIEERRESADRLLRKDAERRALLAAMTHEIYNPLNVIFSSLHMAESESSSELPPSALRSIGRAARQILEVTQDALEVGRVGSDRTGVRLERLWLPALWRDLHDDCRDMRCPAGVALLWMSPAPDVTVLTDRRRIEMIVRNLVGNALKFTERGWVRVEARLDAAFLTLVVEDTGIGIPAADREGVFELYRRGSDEESRRRRGSGVGLYLVRECVAQLDGSIVVDSVPGLGSTFTVRLPRAEATSHVA